MKREIERREFLRWLSIAGLGFMVGGCSSLGASLKRIGRHAVTGSPTGSWSGGSFFPPQAGLLIVENPNPAVWAETFLLQGYFNRRSVFTYDSAGRIVFVVKPVAYTCISAPISRSKDSVLDLRSFAQKVLPSYPAKYTLVVFHRNFWWQMVGKPEVKHFRISSDPFNDEFILNGRKVMCDKFIRLGSRNAYEKTYFRINFELALRDYIPW